MVVVRNARKSGLPAQEMLGGGGGELNPYQHVQSTIADVYISVRTGKRSLHDPLILLEGRGGGGHLL